MILMTGASGFLGRQILGRLLLEHPDKEFCLPIRNSLTHSAEQRTEIILREIFDCDEQAALMSKRIHTVEADITQNQLGIEKERYDTISEKLTSIIHSAATTHLNEEQEVSNRVNVGGTKNILSLSERSSFHNKDDFSLHHISTAYVAGDVERIVQPHELSLDVQFKNSYERSKAMSESLVRAQANNFKCVIYRPSIIVGDSITGQTSAFNVIYIPLKLIFRGLFTGFPARPHVPFDVVPVDYVADAIVEIFSQDVPSGSCFHLSSGVGRESTPREIMEMLAQTALRFGGKKMNVPSFLSPELMNKAISSLCAAANKFSFLESLISKRLVVAQQIMPFVPYMLRNPQFDTGTTQDILRVCSSRPPLFKHYAEEIITYCLETNWGRNPWSNPRNLSSWYNRLDYKPA